MRSDAQFQPLNVMQGTHYQAPMLGPQTASYPVPMQPAYLSPTWPGQESCMGSEPQAQSKMPCMVMQSGHGAAGHL